MLRYTVSTDQNQMITFYYNKLFILFFYSVAAAAQSFCWIYFFLNGLETESVEQWAGVGVWDRLRLLSH